MGILINQVYPALLIKIGRILLGVNFTQVLRPQGILGIGVWILPTSKRAAVISGPKKGVGVEAILMLSFGDRVEDLVLAA